MSSNAAPGRFGRVLCAIDFSDDSRRALRAAAAIALAARGSLTALYVNDPLLLAAAAAGYELDALDAASRKELDVFVRRTLGRRTLARLRPACEIATGTPAREIIRYADAAGCDLIVAGTRGLNGARKLFFGSTAAGLLQRTHVPVLVTPFAGGGGRGRRVAGRLDEARGLAAATALAGIDLGLHTAADVRRFVAAAQRLDLRLSLVHVVTVGPAPPWYRRSLADQIKRRTAAAARRLTALQTVHADAIRSVTVTSGHPPTEIAKVAARLKAAVVLLTLRRKPGIAGSPAGSIAYHVLCQRVAPVLALPTKPALPTRVTPRRSPPLRAAPRRYQTRRRRGSPSGRHSTIKRPL